MSAFEKLNSINVNDHTEKKNGLTYLSWAWAWGELLKAYPDSTYKVYENQDGWNYFTDGRTAWVKTGVTVDGKECIEMLPVMNYKNNSIPLEQITSFDVNKAIQRSLTKAVARHGLGLYIYAGEDLPEDEAEAKKREEEERKAQRKQTKPQNVTVTVNNQTVPKTPTKAQIYVANEIAHMKEMFGVSDTKEMTERFGMMRSALIADGIIPDVPSADQSTKQAEQMIEAIYKHFTPKGERI